MASIPELHVVDHWRYKAEGNANLVLQYIGPDPRFSSTVLRLRKSDRVLQPDLAREDTRLHAQSESAVKDLSKEIAYQSKVMALLLGDEFVEHPILVSLPRSFLERLAAAVEPTRPHHRLQKGIDLTRETGLLSLDHTRFIHSHPSNPTIAIELKSSAIKRRKCRFCMYRYLKALEAKEQELSGYCPIDLFSAQEGLVQYALDALVKTPQNNLRLFIDGEQQPVTEEIMERAFSMSPSGPDTGEAKAMTTGVSLNALLTEILIRSPFLTRLSRLQQGMDYLDIEVIHQFYDALLSRQNQPSLNGADTDTETLTDNADTVSSPKKKTKAMGLPEPTVDEYLNAAEAFLERSGLDMLSELLLREEFDERLKTSVGFEPEDNLEEDVPDAIKEHYLREFLLAATLKDCSLIVTMERIVPPHPEQQQSQPHNSTLEQHASRHHGLHEREHRIQLGGCEYRYKMVCIDLDPKKINAIPRYLNKDRQTVSHYLRMVGDNEEACGTH
ncbi:Inositol-pentakisphosphate 2-kinase [Actinomortierella ambigua]|nr:Inositol-pentakisphosphate 2-kinase [Actinomortierella ambigua]